MKVRVFIEDAGCNRRKLDLSNISAYLKCNEYEIVDSPDDADKILVGTCAFKKQEEDESIQRVRHYTKYGDKVVVYGCLPDIARERYKEFSEIPKVAPREIQKIVEYFPGTTKKYSDVVESNLVEARSETIFNSLARIIQTQPTLDWEFFHRMVSAGSKKLSNLVNPPAPIFYLFVCRGCLGRCSYCAIRRSIGSVYSKPIADVLIEFKRGIDEGFREFTILGDDPGCYGIDLGRSLPELMQALIDAGKVEGACLQDAGAMDTRITFQLNEIHPKYLIAYTEPLLAIRGCESIRSILCPIQSGSNRILALMQREHLAEQFEETVKNIRAQEPQMMFNTQIIVGFPSETEEEFQATLDLVARCKFETVVVFPYDDKDGIASSVLLEKIPEKTIQERMKKAFRFFANAGVKAYYKCP